MHTTKEVRNAIRQAAADVGAMLDHSWTDMSMWGGDKRYVTFHTYDRTKCGALVTRANAILGTNNVRVTQDMYIRATAYLAA